KYQLGENVDKDPEWRDQAIFARSELAQLISDDRIPEHRRVLYGLEGLGALRLREAAGLLWRHYDPEREPLGRRMGPMRHKGGAWEKLQADLKALGLRARRGHDLRRTMISLAQDDAAVRAILRESTHGRSRRDVVDDHTTLQWKTLCNE